MTVLSLPFKYMMEKDQKQLIRELIEIKMKTNSDVSVSEMKTFIREQNKIVVDPTLVAKSTLHNFITTNMRRVRDNGTCLTNKRGQGRKVNPELSRLITEKALNQVLFTI